MPDGTIMDGPLHGSGQVCIEWERPGYNKGGKIANPNFNPKMKKKRNASDYSAGGKFNRKGTLKYSPGGMLIGPSHEQGGIQAIVDGTEPIEVEGGEFIINKQTVDAVGEEFLHKLNSTQTTHHTGGYGAGELPGPSNFKGGGRVKNPNGKRFKKRKLAGGGHTHEHQHTIQSPGATSAGSWNTSAEAFAHIHEVMPGSEVDEPNMWGVAGPPRADEWQGHIWNQDDVHSAGPTNQMSGSHNHPSSLPKRQRGGRLNRKTMRAGGSTNRRRSVRRYAGGGRIGGRVANKTVRPLTKMRKGGSTTHQFKKNGLFEDKRKFPVGGSTSPFSFCRSLGSDATTCKNTPGCTWNPDGPSCH